MTVRMTAQFLVAVTLLAGCTSHETTDVVEEHSIPIDYSAPQIFEAGQAKLTQVVGGPEESTCVVGRAVDEVGIERFETRYGVSAEATPELSTIDVGYDLVDAQAVGEAVEECVDLGGVMRDVLAEKQVPIIAHQCTVRNGIQMFGALVDAQLNRDDDLVREVAAQLNWTVASCIELEVQPQPQIYDGPTPELASTPEFCVALAALSGSLEVVGRADLTTPTRLEVAYTNIERDVTALEPLVPNAGVQNDIDELVGLYLPLVDAFRTAQWDIDAIEQTSPDRLAESPLELQELTDRIADYGVYECGHDLAAIETAAVDDFEYEFTDTPPKPED